jgi:hypothetical protein
MVLYIDANYLKSTTTLPLDVNENLVRTSIFYAQEKYIKQAIGSGVYSELQTQIGTTGLTTLNQYLLDNHIIQTLGLWTMYELIPHLSMQLKNRGVGTKPDEFFNPASTADVQILRNEYKNTATFFSQRMSQYLKQNITVYPLYGSPDNGSPESTGLNIVIPASSAYDCGIYLPGFLSSGFGPGNIGGRNDDMPYGVGFTFPIN